MTWINKHEERGVWRYDGEIDLGYGAALHTARTIVIQDSIFGLHAYGGNLQIGKSKLSVIPKDGVRQQFSYVVPTFRYHFTLSCDGFKKDAPVEITSNGKQTHFILENSITIALNDENTEAHTTVMQIRAEKTFPQQVLVSGKPVPVHQTTTGWEVKLPVNNLNEEVIIQWK